MVTILGVRGLDSSVNIMRFINKNMLVICVNTCCHTNVMLPHKCFFLSFFFSDSFESRSAVQILYAKNWEAVTTIIDGVRFFMCDMAPKSDSR